MIGSIPVAYLAARWTGGVDLRETGSRNVGASNVWQSASKAMVVPVGFAQIAQGLCAVLVARALGQGAAVQVASGLAAIVAQQWDPWLALKGGRGVGAAIGFMIALSVPVLVVFAALSVVGVAVRRIPQAMLLAIIATPFAALAAGERAPVVAGFGALALLLIAKRLAANGMPADGGGRSQVLLNRLLYDRDIRDREAWVRRAADSR